MSSSDNATASSSLEKLSASKAYTRVFGYCDGLGWAMNAVALVCMIASGTLLPIMDIVFGRFVTVFNSFATGTTSPDEFRSQISKYTLYYLYLFIGKFVLGYIWTVLVSASAIRTTRALRIDFLKQTLRQDVAFFDSPESPSISGQITTNGNLVNQSISEKLGITIQAMTSFVTAFIVAFAVQWKLTLIVVGIVPANLIVTFGCLVFDVIYENGIMKTYAKADSLAGEVFANMRSVHAFCAYPKLSRRFDAILADAKLIEDKKSIIFAIMFSFEFFAVFAGYALAFWQGIRLYASGEISNPGTVVTVVFAVIVAAQSLTQIAPQAIQISKGIAAAQELFSIIDRKSAIDSLASEGVKPLECEGNLELTNIGFTYPSRPTVPVLDDFTLSIPANKTTALVGSSGSGKSTIVGLIERWYSPTTGRITVDGHDISTLNIQWLRTNIRLVQQEPTLFNGTILQNVSYGLAGTDMQHRSDQEVRKMVEDACKAAFAHDFIKDLPNGYDTEVGERGATLSGGQRQRIVIARSIISDPRILLLDEATSALDPKAESLVQQALNNVGKGRTMVVIAHRLSTIRDADCIIVMSQGKIVERGTHSELMAAGGSYASLVRTQDLRDEEDTLEEPGDSDGPGEDLVKKETTILPENLAPQIAGSNSMAGGKINYSLLKCITLIIKEQRVLWFPMGMIGVCSFIGGATYPALAILFSRVMTTFELNGSDMTSRGNFWSLMFFVVAIANLFAYAVFGWYCNVITQGVVKSYRHDIFQNTMQQRMEFFDDPDHTPGALTSRLSSEPTNLMELLSGNIGLIIINVVNVVASCILAIIVGWKLGLVLTFGALPPLIFAGYLRIRLEFKLSEDTDARFASSSGIASEAIMAIRTVSSLALENKILTRYQESLNHIARHSIGSLGWRMLWFSLSQSISFLAMALGFWFGGRLMSYGEYTSSQFYLVFIATVFSGEAAAAFFQYSTSITKARASANYIFQLRQNIAGRKCHTPPELDDEKSGAGATVSSTELEFSYPRRPLVKVLRNINININPGQFVAFVGPSGCGKTTMVSLLERFYDPTSGTLSFDGRDIESLEVKEYRKDIALVQQEPVLYSGSVRDNISLGIEDREPTDEEVISACRQTNIWEFLSSLPEGLNTPCGAQGLQLSGGQRQRISIARALIRQPRLLLLDEATSALDTESEKVVKEALDRASKGRTTIAVAHRLSTIMDADNILVFLHGRIVESGTHASLLEKRGLYYEMCLGQSLDRAL